LPFMPLYPVQEPVLTLADFEPWRKIQDKKEQRSNLPLTLLFLSKNQAVYKNEERKQD